MRIMMETLFDAAYLISTVILGIRILQKSTAPDLRLFGILCLTLVFGDAFHLVPRMIGLNSAAGLEGYTAQLGIGKLITSLTMTGFYVMLYSFIAQHFRTPMPRWCGAAVWGLALVRVALCLFPQNGWTSADAPIEWGIYRNIPFALLGLLIVLLLYRYARTDRYFRWSWLAVTLSFGFYLPVVLWSGVSPLVGMLMLPKTCCYIWIVHMGYRCAGEKA